MKSEGRIKIFLDIQVLQTALLTHLVLRKLQSMYFTHTNTGVTRQEEEMGSKKQGPQHGKKGIPLMMTKEIQDNCAKQQTQRQADLVGENGG